MSNRRAVRVRTASSRSWFLSEMLRGEEERIVSRGLSVSDVNQTLLSLKREGFEIVTRDGMFIADHPEITIYVRPER